MGLVGKEEGRISNRESTKKEMSLKVGWLRKMNLVWGLLSLKYLWYL